MSTPILLPSPTSTQISNPSLTASPEDHYERLLSEYPEIREYIRLLQARDAMPAGWAID
ncbi:MAG: hypothetical protein HYX86_06685, partial [Chloroflexi bacterium]|nr:hypothetical protein [Chloroflexota bacterium]